MRWLKKKTSISYVSLWTINKCTEKEFFGLFIRTMSLADQDIVTQSLPLVFCKPPRERNLMGKRRGWRSLLMDWKSPSGVDGFMRESLSLKSIGVLSQEISPQSLWRQFGWFFWVITKRHRRKRYHAEYIAQYLGDGLICINPPSIVYIKLISRHWRDIEISGGRSQLWTPFFPLNWLTLPPDSVTLGTCNCIWGFSFRASPLRFGSWDRVVTDID